VINRKRGCLFTVREVGKALVIVERLESAELRPNIVKSGPNYVVNIAMSDLLNLAVKDDAIRRAMALYLAEKVKNGTPRQREIAEKILHLTTSEPLLPPFKLRCITMPATTTAPGLSVSACETVGISLLSCLYISLRTSILLFSVFSL
jgi:hypothetical protein